MSLLQPLQSFFDLRLLLFRQRRYQASNYARICFDMVHSQNCLEFLQQARKGTMIEADINDSDRDSCEWQHLKRDRLTQTAPTNSSIPLSGSPLYISITTPHVFLLVA